MARILLIEDDQAIRDSLSALLDLLMPVMDGWHFIEAMKKIRSFATIPIVAVTALADRGHGIENIEVLRKPLELGVLTGVVKNIVARRCLSLE